jgi:hypothetical protein
VGKDFKRRRETIERKAATVFNTASTKDAFSKWLRLHWQTIREFVPRFSRRRNFGKRFFLSFINNRHSIVPNSIELKRRTSSNHPYTHRTGIFKNLSSMKHVGVERCEVLFVFTGRLRLTREAAFFQCFSVEVRRRRAQGRRWPAATRGRWRRCHQAAPADSGKIRTGNPRAVGRQLARELAGSSSASYVRWSLLPRSTCRTWKTITDQKIECGYEYEVTTWIRNAH